MIRIAALERADQLARVAAGVFDNEVRPDYLTAFIEQPSNAMFIAVDDGVVVGMASGFVYGHPDKPLQMFINEVGVSEDYRRKGIGRQLVQALLNEAKSRGCTDAWLGTELMNESGNACFSSVPNVEPAEAFYLYEWDLTASGTKNTSS